MDDIMTLNSALLIFRKALFKKLHCSPCTGGIKVRKRQILDSVSINSSIHQLLPLYVSMARTAQKFPHSLPFCVPLHLDGTFLLPTELFNNHLVQRPPKHKRLSFSLKNEVSTLLLVSMLLETCFQ